MKISPVSSLLALAASALSVQAADQSGPFNLIIVNSKNGTLNGQSLYSCHAGAAIEGICVGGRTNDTTQFFFNPAGDTGNSGTLIYNLPVQTNDSDHVSEPMSLTYQVGSNVAVPMFTPESGTGNVQAVFTKDERLVLQTWYDDSKFTAGPSIPADSTKTVELSHWYVCYTVVGTYFYEALAWVTSGAPHNPTCQAVEVVRKFV